MKPIPHEAKELIEDLEAANPPKCKDPNESLEQHARYAGRVELIEELRIRLDWTEKHTKTGDLPL